MVRAVIRLCCLVLLGILLAWALRAGAVPVEVVTCAIIGAVLLPPEIGWSFVEIVRRPISTILTVIVGFGSSAVALAFGLLVTAAGFGWVRVVARTERPLPVTLGIGPLGTTRDFRPLVFLLAVVILASAWILALAISGVTSAWRSAALTHEVAAAMGRRRRPRSDSSVPRPSIAPDSTLDVDSRGSPQAQ